MEQIHERVAGLDVHRDSVSACARVPGVRSGRRCRARPAWVAPV